MLGLTSEEQQTLLLSVGTHRKERRLSPVEVARLLRKAIDAGATRQQCAELLQVGTTQISVFLNLLKLAPDIQHLADWGNAAESAISFSSLAQLLGLRLHSDQIQAARSILAHRLTWKEVVQLVQLRNRSGKSIDECVASVLKLRPEIDTRYVFVGSIGSPQLRATLSRLTQRERDELLKHALRGMLSPSEGLVGRLGTDRFTIVGSKDPPRLLNVSPDVFENSVNRALVSEASRL